MENIEARQDAYLCSRISCTANNPISRLVVSVFLKRSKPPSGVHSVDDGHVDIKNDTVQWRASLLTSKDDILIKANRL